jgi:hypothetical protein
MSNYPENFTSTNMDAGKCVVCSHQDYTDDDGICGECNHAMQRFERAQSVMSTAIDKCFSPGATLNDQLAAISGLIEKPI